jgi:hypothetical protein
MEFYKKIFLIFMIMGIICITISIFIIGTDSDRYNGKSYVVVENPPSDIIYSDKLCNNDICEYTSSPNKDDIDKIYYKVVIDGVESIVTLNSNRETNDEWIINKTIVGNDKDNVTLIEYMRYDGTTYERVEYNV